MKLSLFLFFFLYVFCVKAEEPKIPHFPSIREPQKHAFLVCTSKDWIYYQHQSSLLHAYQTLIKNGIPAKNIITMFYDDIATHKLNKEKGAVRSHPKGPNVYENVQKDYTGQDVNLETFVGVITGNKSLTNDGPVLESSSPRDTAFIYIVGQGSWRYLPFPTGPGISSPDFVDLLEDLREQKKFAKVLVHLDLMFGASLVNGVISTNKKILVISSTDIDEFPASAYCFPDERRCFSSLDGAVANHHSDRLRQLKTGGQRTVFDYFNWIRSEIGFGHVNIYGDFSIGQSLLKDFLGYHFEGKPDKNAPKLGFSLASESSDDTLRRKIKPMHEYVTNYGAVKQDIFGIDEQKRNFATNTSKKIFEKLQSRGHKVTHHDELKDMLVPVSDHDDDTYKQSIQAYNKLCFDINENPYILREIPKLAYLGKMGVSLEEQVAAMEDVCNSEHRQAKSIH